MSSAKLLCRAARILLPLATLLAAQAHAAGPTGEVEDWAELQVGKHALAIAPDGRRVAYIDTANWLRRENAADGAAEPPLALPLPWRVIALSASDGAERVALVTPQGCSALADFGALATIIRTAENGVPEGPLGARWLAPLRRWPQALAFAVAHPPLRLLQDQQYGDPREGTACTPRSDAFTRNGPDYEFNAIALSPDGRRVVLGDGSLLDADTGASLQRVPTGNAVVGLRFVDGGRKLFTVQAQLGEGYESASSPSDMEYALWDVARGELLNFVKAGQPRSLSKPNYLWDFSAAGHVRLLDSEADLTQCGAAFEDSRTLPPADNRWAFAADPLGRWIAVVEDPQLDNDGKATGPAQLLVFGPEEGPALQRWALEAPIRALQVSPDGRTLFATTQSESIPQRWTDEYGQRRGGGELRRFALDPALAAAPARDVGAGTDAVCRLEDEQPDARNIALDARPHATAFTLDLSDRPPPHQRTLDAPLSVGDSSVEMPQRWGVTPDDALWVDRYKTLERIDPTDGHVLAHIDTPRSADAFALVLYERAAFLVGAGDSVKFIPFDAHGLAAPHEFARKRGFRAERIEVRSGRALVRWADVRFAGKTRAEGDPEEQADGSGVGTLYDLATAAPLFEYPGRASENSVGLQAEFDDPEEINDLFAPDGVAAPTPPPAASDWSLSYFDSVRAVEQVAPGNRSETVLWDGLKFDAADTYREIRTVLPLAHGTRAAAVGQSNVIVYDAVRRRRSARLPFGQVSQAAALPSAHRVLLERDGHLIALDFH